MDSLDSHQLRRDHRRSVIRRVTRADFGDRRIRFGEFASERRIKSSMAETGIKSHGEIVVPLVHRASVLSVLAASDPLLYFGEKDGRKMI